MALAAFMQDLVQPLDLRIDPGVRAVIGGRRAQRQNAGEIAVAMNLEFILAQGSGEPPRQMKTVQRQDPTLVRVDEKQAAVVAPLGHRENADGIGLQ